MERITRDELWNAIQAKDKLTLVEALPQRDFDQGHLPGALRIAKDEVDTLAPKLLPDKNERIVVYCSDEACQASPTVAKRLTELGYANVADYSAGKADWIKAGRPLETTPTIAAV